MPRLLSSLLSPAHWVPPACFPPALGSTTYSATRLQVRPGERSWPAAARRASARSLSPRTGTGHAQRAARSGRERVCGRADPHFTGSGGRGGACEREVRAVLARKIAPLHLGADGCSAARGGSGGRRLGRRLSPGRLAPCRLRGKLRPRRQIQGKSPFVKGARRGFDGLNSPSILKIRLCVLGWNGARRRVCLHSL